jgi:predicted HicB family RNase H-like nuclease
MTVMAEDGFLAEISIDEEAGVLRGVIVNHRERAIRFAAETVPLLRQAMRKEIHRLREEAATGSAPAPSPYVSVDDIEQMRASETLGKRSRPPGAQDYQPLAAAYNRLLSTLDRAQEELVSGSDFGRRGAAIACASVVLFLNHRWENPELAAPFLALENALADVLGGVRPELFFGGDESLKRSRSTAYRKTKDFAAALVEVIYRLSSVNGTGREAVLKNAAVQVARAVNDWPSISRGTAVTERTVREWRDSVRSRQPAGRRDFDAMVEYLTNLPPAERDREIEVCLRGGPPGKAKAVS